MEPYAPTWHDGRRLVALSAGAMERMVEARTASLREENEHLQREADELRAQLKGARDRARMLERSMRQMAHGNARRTLARLDKAERTTQVSGLHWFLIGFDAAAIIMALIGVI